MERTVLVTGASSAVGRATVAAFADEEWTVYAAVHDHSAPGDETTSGDGTGRDEGTATGDAAHGDGVSGETTHDDAAGRGVPDGETIRHERIDVTDRRDVTRVVERVTDETDRLDALVTLPGRPQFGPFEDTPSTSVSRVFERRVVGTHRTLRATLPELRRQDGTVVTVTTAAASSTAPGSGVHAGTQTALAAATDALRRESPASIDVVRVETGPVAGSDPPAVEPTDPDDRNGAYDSVYALFDDWGRLGPDNPLSVRPEEVADGIVNAASSTQPDSRYPVGSVARLAGLARLLPAWVTDAGWRVVRRFA